MIGAWRAVVRQYGDRGAFPPNGPSNRAYA